MHPLKRFRLKAAAWGAFLTLTMALLVALFDERAATGVLMGGAAGTLGYWLLAARLEHLPKLPRKRLVLDVYKWVAVRLMIYGFVLILAYRLDPVHLRVFAGAAGGLILLLWSLLIVAGLSGVKRRARG